MITSENYVKEAMRTDCVYDEAMKQRLVNCIELLHGAMGMVTEAGELIDMLKKHIFYGKNLDIVNALEEVGDEFWYNAKVIDAVNKLKEHSYTMDNILTLNNNKLKMRYPEKFTSDCAVNRNIEDERKLLESKEFVSDVKGEILFNNALQFTEVKQYSKRGMDFIRFASKVLNHIEEYTVPQYGDKGEDQASEWPVEMLLEQNKKYANRYGKNQREGQEMLDFMKACHYVQMAATKFEEERN